MKLESIFEVRRTRGRAPVGQRAIRVVDGRRGKNITIIFAISNQRGLLKYDLIEGGMTGNRFVQFLQSLSDENNNESLVMIFDNAPAHRKALGENGPNFQDRNHEVANLPPYSPFLNPVEHAISAFKAVLKKQLEEIRPQLLNKVHDLRMAHLAQLSEQAMTAITPAKSRNWFGRT